MVARDTASSFRTLDWDGSAVVAIDQTLLPHEEVFLRIREVEDLAEAIVSLRIRGAMGLGVAGGLGLALAIRRAQEAGTDPIQAAEAAARRLAETRPTAANLFRGIEHVQSALPLGADAAIDAAVGLIDADVAANRAIAERGAAFICDELLDSDDAFAAMTHCNAGALAGVEIGTALGVLGAIHAHGRLRETFACETRPLLQGARLTMWELDRMQIPCSLIVDSAAAGLIARGSVAVVVVGADRIAANGDVANKVGTFSHALAARYAGIPFVVAAPEMTIDLACPSGSQIPIEERSADEVLNVGGAAVAPPNVGARNPAFDVTPAELVTAIITEERVIRTARGETPARAAEPVALR
jgi:methylthioribose-1-phosphate isomerase